MSPVFQMKDSLVQELQQKAEETELLQVELRMLETERVRLSLVEEKLMDILQLLQQLRDLVSPVGTQGPSDTTGLLGPSYRWQHVVVILHHLMAPMYCLDLLAQ